MRNIIFTSLIAGLTALPALAGPPQGCFVRHYTAQHLAANPAQVVASAWLRLYQAEINPGQTEFLADLSVVTAEQGHAQKAGLGGQFFTQGLFCWPDKERGDDAWGCAVECDGGSFRITRDDGKVLEFSTDYLMVGDTEGCGGAVDLAERPNTPVTYRLYRADGAECEAN